MQQPIAIHKYINAIVQKNTFIKHMKVLIEKNLLEI